MTRKDFRVEWYSGSGAGGQHRNKHQNCCRITHLETGIQAVGTEGRSRTQNQTSAFLRLAQRLTAHYSRVMDDLQPPPPDHEVRLYHAVRNEVRDHASGVRLMFTQVYDKDRFGELLEASVRARPEE